VNFFWEAKPSQCCSEKRNVAMAIDKTDDLIGETNDE
jgi:hypothetical protein